MDLAPNTYAANCKVLIENGDADDHVGLAELTEWKAEMDAQGIDWRFNNHARTPHGFALAPRVWSNTCAHSWCLYVEEADRRSTRSMLSLFAEVWPQYPQYPTKQNACGTVLGQSITPTAKL